MALKEILVDGQPILVEVTDLHVEGRAGAEGESGFEYTATTEDMGDRIRGIMRVLSAPVRETLAKAGAAEWTMEVSMGFKGESGLPFIAKGELNGTVKVTATWAKGS